MIARLIRLIFLSLIFFINSAIAQPVWEKNQFEFFLKDNVLELYHQKNKLVEIKSFEFNFVEPDKIKVEKTTNDSLFLKLSFSAGDGFHDDFPKEILLSIAQFNNTFHFTASHKNFSHITIQLKDQDEHYFGLIEKLFPHNSKNPDLRGNVVDLEVYGNGSADYAENYASAYSAFYMSSLGYGSFFDTFAKGRYILGINGRTEIYHQTNKLDWYIFYGPTGEKIHSEYYSVIGKPKYIPIWACGPIFWRDQNNGGKDEILNDIKNFTELKIPLTACFVDRPYSNGANEWSKMDFSGKFSEPEKWIKIINDEYGMQFMTWVAPMTFSDKDFPGLLSNYKGYIDLTDPQALAEFEKRLNENQYMAGVKGHKMDRSDENFPVTALWNQPVPESETRNKYVYLYSKVINNFLTKAHGKDQFNFARAAFHRTQPFLSAIWGGDSRNNWIGMSGSMANSIRCGFMGFPDWGNDTGGYLGEGRINELLYIRWLQWSVWNGMFEIKIDGAGGSGEDRPPWKYSGQLQNVFRNSCELRMQMLPYIYSCANTSYKNGVIMKPLTYLYPEDVKTYIIWDEFIFGNAFLIAPVFSNKCERDIYLPEGKWYDFNEIANEYSGPLTIHQNAALEKIPVFIRANSIYVTGDIFRGNSKIWEGNLEGTENITIHLFPGKVNDMYEFTYVDYLNNDKEINMSMSCQEGKINFTSPAISTISKIAIKCFSKPEKILLNNKSVEFDFNEDTKIAELHCGQNMNINLEVIY